MGQSTDAYLFFGFDFHDGESSDDDLWYDAADILLNDWDEEYAVRRGTPRPTMAYEENKDAHRAFWDAKNKLVEESGCTINTHCSGEYPVFFVCITESYLRASRGYPTEVPEGHTVPAEGWVDKLKAFCEVMGITWREPKWYLASYWG
jgi:hypothetical protein